MVGYRLGFLFKVIALILLLSIVFSIPPSLTEVSLFVAPFLSFVDTVMGTLRGIIGQDVFSGESAYERDIGLVYREVGATGETVNVKEYLTYLILSDNKIIGLNVGQDNYSFSIPYIDKNLYNIVCQNNYVALIDNTVANYKAIRFTLRVSKLDNQGKFEDSRDFDLLWIGVGNRNGIANDYTFRDVVGDYNGLNFRTSIYIYQTDAYANLIWNLNQSLMLGDIGVDEANFNDGFFTDYLRLVKNFNSITIDEPILDVFDELSGG